MLFEAGVKVLPLLFLFSGLQSHLRKFGLVGRGVHIHDMHIVITDRPLRPKVSDN